VVANSQQEKWEAVYGASLSGKRSLMFAEAEIVDFVSRSGKTRTLKETIQNKLMPSLRVQPGFVDEIILESDVEPNRVLALSFWKTREQAERYGQERYPAVKEVLLVSLETDPLVRTFNVASSRLHNMTAGRAA
jgi:heme-degrading monooxygenase HmoA